MKVYMRADENEAGVTVEDDPNGDGIKYEFREGDYHDVGHVYERQFRPFVEGLLRRMLERDGFDAANDLLVGVVRKWQSDGRPGR